MIHQTLDRLLHLFKAIQNLLGNTPIPTIPTQALTTITAIHIPFQPPNITSSTTTVPQQQQTLLASGFQNPKNTTYSNENNKTTNKMTNLQPPTSSDCIPHVLSQPTMTSNTDNSLPTDGCTTHQKTSFPNPHFVNNANVSNPSKIPVQTISATTLKLPQASAPPPSNLTFYNTPSPPQENPIHQHNHQIQIYMLNGILLHLQQHLLPNNNKQY